MKYKLNYLFITLITILAFSFSYSALVINEVDADQTGTDAGEFVELYNTGPGVIDFSVDTYQVVFFNGSNDTSYAVYNLDAGSVSVGGFVILGNSAITGSVTADVEITFADNFLQNGMDGVGLYTGANFTGTNEGIHLNTGNLVDGLVYDTDDADDPGLLPILASGDGVQVNENANTTSITDSCQRYPNGSGALLSGTPFVVRTATPAAINVPVELSGFTTK